MGKFGDCYINLDGGVEVYRKGDLIKGTVSLHVLESVDVKAIKIYFCGEALTKWNSPFEKEDRIGKESYVNNVLYLFEKKGDSTASLPTGNHKYNFTFRCPNEGLPSSFEGLYGAVRYWLKVVVQRPIFSFDKKWYRCITVLDNIDVKQPKYQGVINRRVEKAVSKTLGFGNAGTLSVSASCDRKAYCPGEQIALNVLVKNDTSKDMGKLNAKLVQFVKFKASGNENETTTEIKVIAGNTIIEKGAQRKWVNQLLQVPAISPTTTLRSCHIILVSYYVEVWVEVPWGFDASVTLPITIGTLPFNRNTAPVPSTSASNSLEIDASGALCNTKCGYVQRFTESNGNFSNLSYTPMCCYVPNYKFIPKNKVVAKANAKTGAVPKAAPQTRKPPITNSAPTNPPVPLQPTAPPLPPSYEEVMAMDSQRAKPESTQAVEVPKSDKYMLLIRFADIYLNELRSYVKQNGKELKIGDGELIALSAKPIVDPSNWPSQTSIAIFMFATAESATNWFRTSTGITATCWYKSCDAIVNKTFEVFNDSNLQFVMNYIRLKKTCDMKARRAYLMNAIKNLRPKRISLGGVILSNSPCCELLKGDWVDKSLSLVLNQWPSLDVYIKYRHFVSEVYEQDEKNADKFYEIQGSIVFQSEDVSSYQWREADDKLQEKDENNEEDDQAVVVSSGVAESSEEGNFETESDAPGISES